MPYIAQHRRPKYDEAVDALIRALREEDYPGGDLNYIVFRLCLDAYMHEPRYASLEKVRGMLGIVWDELWRRWGGKHEEVAMQTNGDVP
jgi:hypothetical protein